MRAIAVQFAPQHAALDQLKHGPRGRGTTRLVAFGRGWLEPAIKIVRQLEDDMGGELDHSARSVSPRRAAPGSILHGLV